MKVGRLGGLHVAFRYRSRDLRLQLVRVPVAQARAGEAAAPSPALSVNGSFLQMCHLDDVFLVASRASERVVRTLRGCMWRGESRLCAFGGDGMSIR